MKKQYKLITLYHPYTGKYHPYTDELRIKNHIPTVTEMVYFTLHKDKPIRQQLFHQLQEFASIFNEITFSPDPFVLNI